jgi:hypothetical protein
MCGVYGACCTLIKGVPPTCRLGCAKHHPQKRHLPRQAGLVQGVVRGGL